MTPPGHHLTITEEHVERYHRDGVVLLRDQFADWIPALRAGLSENLDHPTERARAWDRDNNGVSMFWDSQAWQGIDAYRDFVHHSRAAELAGRLMRSSTATFFFDAVFVRSPGSQFETPWHQDEPYWSVEGYDTCTIWMPLVPVSSESALSFVPGSHRSSGTFNHYNFGRFNPDNKDNVAQSDFSPIATEELPDIDADRAAFGVVSWDMEPGDCVVFNGRTLHGGSGRLNADNDLRVFTTKWVGDEARIAFRSHGMDPDHSALMISLGLGPGDRLATDVYPTPWWDSGSSGAEGR